LTVTLASGGNTVAQVVTAVNASGSAAKGIIRADAGSGNGSGNISAFTKTAMAGGVGLYSGNTVLVSGVDCKPLHAASSPVQTWTDTKLEITVPDLTALTPARAATDVAEIMVSSDGIVTKLGVTLA
jgi:hypothetical protein